MCRQEKKKNRSLDICHNQKPVPCEACDDCNFYTTTRKTHTHTPSLTPVLAGNFNFLINETLQT